MKILPILIGVVVLGAGSAIFLYALPPRPPKPRPDQLLELFDADGDDVISASEIENAPEILRSRDLDRNGMLTRDELPRPPRPIREHEPVHEHDGFDSQPRRHDRQSVDIDLQDAPAGTVVFSGGYDTDPRDHGRPVALIAAALGVKAEVFREAFSGVTPARFGPPSPSHARANKQILMDALGKYLITNDRLDEVSNYYRYRPGSGRLWTQEPATAKAIIQADQVTGVTVVDPGSGYLTVPKVTIAGYEDVEVLAEIEFSKTLSQNGRVSKLTVVSND